MLLTNYSELHNQTCTITTLSHQFYHTIYHTLVLLPHYQTIYHAISHTCTITNLSD